MAASPARADDADDAVDAEVAQLSSYNQRLRAASPAITARVSTAVGSQ